MYHKDKMFFIIGVQKDSHLGDGYFVNGGLVAPLADSPKHVFATSLARRAFDYQG